jgi:hypothetical protein
MRGGFMGLFKEDYGSLMGPQKVGPSRGPYLMDDAYTPMEGELGPMGIANMENYKSPMSIGDYDRMMKEKIKSRSGMGGAKRSNPRAEIVRRIMQQHGLSLPQASSYVKQHGLY